MFTYVSIVCRWAALVSPSWHSVGQKQASIWCVVEVFLVLCCGDFLGIDGDIFGDIYFSALLVRARNYSKGITRRRDLGIHVRTQIDYNYELLADFR